MKDEWVIKVQRLNLTTGTVLEAYTTKPSPTMQFPSPEIVRMAAYLTGEGFNVCYNPSEVFATNYASNTLIHGVTVWSEDDE